MVNCRTEKKYAYLGVLKKNQSHLIILFSKFKVSLQKTQNNLRLRKSKSLTGQKFIMNDMYNIFKIFVN
jgi:hypothetical protein